MHPVAPLPLSRGLLALKASTGVPSTINLTTWGSPLAKADHVAFYFGGMPASAEEPALHSLLAEGEEDVYKARKIHLICIDKPGMGQSPFQYRFSIRRDWPEIVHQVAENFKVNKYGIMGVSNGGPYVMACLTHPKTKDQVSAASMIVGVSDVKASNYFSFRNINGLMEGLYNSLPIVLTGPLNYLLFSAGNLFLFSVGGYEKLFPLIMQTTESKDLVRKIINDGIKTGGLGSAIDCQQGLSPLYAGNTKHIIADYAAIGSPVSLWYGTKDSTVPMATAEWLNDIIPKSKLRTRDSGHGLFFYHTAEILDNLTSKMDPKKSTKKRDKGKAKRRS